MSTHDVTSVSALLALIKKHSQQRTVKVRAATKRAAAKGVSVIKRNVPVAHGEVRESAHAEGVFILVDAPHAAAVNNGSRPHTPPLAPLVEWVRLRGAQGLLTERQQSRLPGTTSAAAAKGIAGMLRAKEVRGPAGYSPVDAAVQVARMIQRAIAKHGTKPHHFIEKSLPQIRAILGEELRAALNEDPKAGAPAAEAGGPSGGPAKAKPPDTRARDSQGKFIKTK